jgi:hypothetical protein
LLAQSENTERRRDHLQRDRTFEKSQGAQRIAHRWSLLLMASLTNQDLQSAEDRQFRRIDASL